MAGDVLGHYRVLEQIGSGGMGLVFRAFDEQLERDVAIKILSPGILTDETSRKHFRREALTLAKLNHPAIATVYEFSSDRGLDFLVMEFVCGVSLDARLARGPMLEREIVRFGFQLADGLSSAHDKGIIHRDLKPANLRLSEHNSLKILDFGLAQLVRLDSDFGVTASIDTASQVTGTLPYMAPEQLRGAEVDHRCDIWAAGAVLYELATARRPFPENQAPLLIDSIFHRQPEPPRSINLQISEGLQNVILKCLDKDPERRYQSARELRVDLQRLEIAASQPLVPVSANRAKTLPRPRLWQAKLAFAALAVILVGLLTYVYFTTSRRTKTLAPAAVSRRRSIAVLSLKNSSGSPGSAWLGTAIPEMLNTELAAGEKLRTVPGEEVSRMKLDLSLPDSDSLSPTTLAQVGKHLAADWVVLGSYVDLPGGQLRIDLHLQDVLTGETLISVPVTGEEKNLFDLVSRAGAQLRAKCGIGQMNAEDESGVRAALPSTTEAAKLYALGLEKLRVSDAIAARDLLQQTIAADPNHALAHSALSTAWMLLGYDDKARQSAKNAYDLSASLSREERLLIEARYRQASKEWDTAAEIYRTLFGFFPDNVEYGLLLAKTQIASGKGKAALATLESLRRLPGPAAEDARIEVTASEAWQSQGNFQLGQTLAAQAIDKAKKQNAKLILARALYEEGSSYEALNVPADALSAVEQASQIYEAIGDQYGLASTLEVQGQVLFDHGDYPAALAKYKQELDLVRKVGNRRAESSALNNMALVLDQQGDAAGAQKLWQESLPIFHEVGDKNGFANTKLNIGGVLKDKGDLAAAKKVYEDALSVFREINDQSGISASLTAVGTVLDAQGNSTEAEKIFAQVIATDTTRGNAASASDRLIDEGDALQHLGDLLAARKNYQDALTTARAVSDNSMTAYALMGLGALATKSADFAAARQGYQEALSLRTQLGENVNISSTQVAIADLAIAEGRPAEAETAVLASRGEFQKAEREDDLIAGTSVLIRALVAEGKTEQAMHEIRKSTPAASRLQNLAIRLEFLLAEAKTYAAVRDYAAAESRAKDALTKATRAGYLGYQLESRLVIAEIQKKSGKFVLSRAELEQLQKDAQEKGFGLIARRAATL
jgi:eukaryotic-like serine/threonine-protein kinase